MGEHGSYRSASASRPACAAWASVVGLVAVADVLGQVLGEVADAPAGVLGSGEHALGVEPGTEPGHVQRLVLVADGVEGLVPGRQHLAGVRGRGRCRCARPRPAGARRRT